MAQIFFLKKHLLLSFDLSFKRWPEILDFFFFLSDESG